VRLLELHVPSLLLLEDLTLLLKMISCQRPILLHMLLQQLDSVQLLLRTELVLPVEVNAILVLLLEQLDFLATMELFQSLVFLQMALLLFLACPLVEV
jgi:hypothetical protein